MTKIIYIKNQHGKEIPWKVENELKNMYEVFHDYWVTHIDSKKIHKIQNDNKEKLIYMDKIKIPEYQET